jgi:hypothetical protein
MAFGHVALRDNGRQWLRDNIDEQPDAGEIRLSLSFVRQILTAPRRGTCCKTAFGSWKKSVWPSSALGPVRDSSI